MFENSGNKDKNQILSEALRIIAKEVWNIPQGLKGEYRTVRFQKAFQTSELLPNLSERNDMFLEGWKVTLKNGPQVLKDEFVSVSWRITKEGEKFLLISKYNPPKTENMLPFGLGYVCSEGRIVKFSICALQAIFNQVRTSEELERIEEELEKFLGITQFLIFSESISVNESRYTYGKNSTFVTIYLEKEES